jgi:hypothetical protein
MAFTESRQVTSDPRCQLTVHDDEPLAPILGPSKLGPERRVLDFDVVGFQTLRDR